MDGRAWWPSDNAGATWLKSSLTAVQSVALFHSLRNPESLLHLVRGGNVGM